MGSRCSWQQIDYQVHALPLVTRFDENLIAFGLQIIILAWLRFLWPSCKLQNLEKQREKIACFKEYYCCSAFVTCTKIIPPGFNQAQSTSSCMHFLKILLSLWTWTLTMWFNRLSHFSSLSSPFLVDDDTQYTWFMIDYRKYTK